MRPTTSNGNGQSGDTTPEDALLAAPEGGDAGDLDYEDGTPPPAEPPPPPPDYPGGGDGQNLPSPDKED